MPAFLVFLLGFAVVRAIDLGDPSGLRFDVNSEYATSYEDYKPRDYKFEYGVSDPHTGDHKSHWEVKENGVVRGEYSLLEPDGTTRVVQYTADHNGFRAVVKKIGHAIHPPTTYHDSIIHSSPIIVPEVEKSYSSSPYYKSYDGAPENYISVVDDSNLASLVSGGLDSHHEISAIPLPQTHILGADIPSLSLDDHSSIDLGSYPSFGIPKAEGIIVGQPILNHQVETIHQKPIAIPESIHIEKPVVIPKSAYIQEPETLLSFKQDPVSIGIRVEHPHGESSSSFVGSTGNLEDDSSYTSYAKGIPSIGWDILGSKLEHSLGLNSGEASIPYPYLSKRSVKEASKKSS